MKGENMSSSAFNPLSLYSIVSDIIKNRKSIKRLFAPTKYLNYNPVFLCDMYRDETPIDDNVPYKEEVCWIKSSCKETIEEMNKISIQKLPQKFELQNDPAELRAFQGEAYAAFKASGKIWCIHRKIWVSIPRIIPPASSQYPSPFPFSGGNRSEYAYFDTDFVWIDCRFDPLDRLHQLHEFIDGSIEYQAKRSGNP